MWSSRSASVCVVSKGVNVHSALCIGIVAGDFPGDGGGSRLGGLLKGDDALDGGFSTNDGNYTCLSACCLTISQG
jgi:hypothetical protein